MQTWRLDDGHQTLVLAARDRRLPEVICWGPPLPAGTDCPALARAGRIDVTGGMLDENPDLSICPEADRSFPGQPGLVVRRGDGELILPTFRYEREESGEDDGSLVAGLARHPRLAGEAIEVPGAWLAGHGLTLPWSFPETMWVVEGERL